jgi:competence protein ComEA
MRTFGLVLAAVLLPALAYAASVNINTADVTQLDTLPGIGPSKAAAIIDYRTRNGPFSAIEDIQKVSGIGPVTFANLKDSITVGVVEQISKTVTPIKVAQPAPPPARSYNQQTVEPADTSTKGDVAHDEVLDAPVAVTDVAATGAALPFEAPSPSLVSSPWLCAFAAVVLLAAGAFVFI